MALLLLAMVAGIGEGDGGKTQSSRDDRYENREALHEFPFSMVDVLISEDAAPTADLAVAEGKDHVRRDGAEQKSRSVAPGVARAASVA